MTPDRDDHHRPLILGSTTVDEVGRRTRKPPTRPIVRFTNRGRVDGDDVASGGLPDDEDYDADEYSGSGNENKEPTKETTTVFNEIQKEPDNSLNTV